MAFIQNFDRIFSQKLHTNDTMYSIEKDWMTLAPKHHVLRLTYLAGVKAEPKTIVLMKTDKGVKIALYYDNQNNPTFIKEQRFRDIRTIDDFKILIGKLIEPYD